MLITQSDKFNQLKLEYEAMLQALRADGMNVYLKLVRCQKRYGYRKEWIYGRLKCIKPQLDVWEAFELYWDRDPGWGHRQWEAMTAIQNEWVIDW